MTSKALTVFYGFATAWYFIYILVSLNGFYYIVSEWHECLVELHYTGYQLISLWVPVIHVFYYPARFYLSLKGNKRYNRILTALFKYVSLPLAFQVAIIFWPLYLMDKGLIDRYQLMDDIPVFNQMTHTCTCIIVVIELFLNKQATTINFSTVFWVANVISMYYVFILNIYLWLSGRWVYPFLEYLPSPFGYDFFVMGNGVSAYLITRGLVAIKEKLEAVLEQTAGHVKLKSM